MALLILAATDHPNIAQSNVSQIGVVCIYVQDLGKIYCLLESGYKVGTYHTHD
jgi:hypothetical protein